MDVGDWLRSLGLEEYEAVIRQNKIDSEVLSELTEGDLEKLGIPLGDRKISRRRRRCSTSLGHSLSLILASALGQRRR